MGPGLEAARRSRIVIASVSVAALAVAALALVGIAMLLGWIDRPGAARPAAPVAAKAPASKALPSEVALLPGEELVDPPPPPRASAPEPLMPRYSSPAPPPPAPRETPRLIEKPLPAEPLKMPAPERRVLPSYAEPREAEPGRPSARDRPSAPRYARREHPTSALDRWPQPEPCETCGEVISVRLFPDLAEVRVRFEDGYVQAIRYPPPPPWRVGDRVRLEGGRLVRD